MCGCKQCQARLCFTVSCSTVTKRYYTSFFFSYQFLTNLKSPSAFILGEQFIRMTNRQLLWQNVPIIFVCDIFIMCITFRRMCRVGMQLPLLLLDLSLLLSFDSFILLHYFYFYISVGHFTVHLLPSPEHCLRMELLDIVCCVCLCLLVMQLYKFDWIYE